MQLHRSLSLLPIIVGCLVSAVGCGARTIGSGYVVSETRAMSGYHAVELAVPGTLNITQGDKEGLVIEAENNVMPLIETSVKPDGTLLISLKANEDLRTTRAMSFQLSVKTLDKMVLTGSGDIHVVGKLSAASETIRLPGSGKITLDGLETGALTVSLEGSGTIKVAAGVATSQNVQLDGSGSYEAGALRTDTAKISVDGSGACKVWSEKRLEVSIGGSGEVSYYGHPELKQRVDGSGAVRALGAKES